MHTELINRQFGLIRQLNPVLFDEESVSLSYEPWEFFRGPNRELSKAQIVVGCFTDSAVSSPTTLQRPEVPQHQRPFKTTSADLLEGRLASVIQQLLESDSASSDVSDIENDPPKLQAVEVAGVINPDKYSAPAPTADKSKRQQKRQPKIAQST